MVHDASSGTIMNILDKVIMKFERHVSKYRNTQ